MRDELCDDEMNQRMAASIYGARYAMTLCRKCWSTTSPQLRSQIYEGVKDARGEGGHILAISCRCKSLRRIFEACVWHETVYIPSLVPGYGSMPIRIPTAFIQGFFGACVDLPLFT